jgi:hypothetical protein
VSVTATPYDKRCGEPSSAIAVEADVASRPATAATTAHHLNLRLDIMPYPPIL